MTDKKCAMTRINISHSRLTTLLRHLSGPAVICLLLCCSVNAQNKATSATDGRTPLGIAPGTPAGSLPLSRFDNINPFNGGLNFSLPLLNVSGRGGAGYTMTLPIEQKWRVIHHYSETPEGVAHERYHPEYNWWTDYKPGYGPGVLLGRATGDLDVECPYPGTASTYQWSLTRLTFTGPDGTEYELRDQKTGGQPYEVLQCATVGFSRGTVFVSGDGMAATFISDQPIVDEIRGGNSVFPVWGYLLLRDGTRYRIEGGVVAWMRDRNGNQMSFTYGLHARVATITDALNRKVTIDYDVQDVAPYGLCDRITYKGFGGQDRVIRVSKRPLGDVLRPDYSALSASQLFPELSGSTTTTTLYSQTVASDVWLPDGNRRYKFSYNSHGELARVELPTEGALEYDWAAGITDGPASGVTSDSGFDREIYRRMIERRSYVDGTTLEGRMTFSRPESMSSHLDYVQLKQFDASDNLLSNEKHFYYGGALATLLMDNPLGYSVWNDGKEYKTQILSADGTDTVLRQVENTWEQCDECDLIKWWATNSPTPPPYNPRLVETRTTLMDVSPNLISKQTLDYDKYNNETDVYEFGYEGSAAVRHTRTQYLTTNPVNGFAYDALNPSSASPGLAVTIHLRNLPVQQSVFDAAGVERARTTYEYDKYSGGAGHAALTSRSDISGLDAAFTSAYEPRGNATATTSYLLSNNGGVSGSISAFQQYDVAGNVVKIIDPRGNATTFNYNDCFGFPDGEAQANTSPSELVAPPSPNTSKQSYAFPTSVTNALGHTAYTQFDYYISKPVEAEDANGVIFSGYYNDALDRPTQVISAVGTAAQSQTSFHYDDPGHTITTTSDQKQYNDNVLKSQALYDGLGRSVEIRQHETVSGNYIAVKQKYDVLGRVIQTSNPYRPWNSENPLYTSTAYDALGRVTAVTTPDNAIASTAFRGNQVLVTDQAGRQRMSRTNAQGQLTDVWEITPLDGATVPVTFPGHSEVSAGYLTHYDYDALNNLNTVTQRTGSQGTTQTRNYTYDSLNRLTSASNPENGSVSYDYDENANLRHKTDARQITTTYSYDALNRITSRTYQNDGGLTQPVYHKYDAQDLPSGAPTFDRGPSTGRLVAVLYGGSNSATGSYQGYDVAGRVKRSFQVTHDGQANQTYTFPNYEYELSGSLKSETYPSGRIVSASYDVVGRLNAINGQKTGEQNKTYVTQLSYTASGAVKEMQLGNGLWEQTILNSRLQPTEIRLGTTQGGVDRLKLTYDYGTTTNNGNVQSQTLNVPTVGSAAGLTLTQNYSYDLLNRLQWVEEKSGAAQVWKQSYAYDRFGNRRIDTGLDLSGQKKTSDNIRPQAFDNPTLSEANNRIDINQGYWYDNAGNLTTTPNRNDQSKSYKSEYDAENYQVSFDKEPVTTPAVKDAAYLHDGDGRRVRKIVDGIITVFVYDVRGLLAAEYATAASSGAGTSYLTSDVLGTPRVITGSDINDGDGGVRARHDYLPFGEELLVGRNNSYTADNLKQRFTSKERDVETGLDYFGARYYASQQGRFISPDDFLNDTHLGDPASWNLYVYVRNNPLNYVDPSGEEVRSIDLKDKEKQKLIDDWKRETGYQDIQFDKSGKLTINEQAGRSGGSNLAARDLLKAVTSTDVRFNLVSVDTTAVAFAEVDAGTTPIGAGNKITRTDYKVRIDFGDFDRASGDKEAKEAFSVGLTAIHEFDHKIYNVTDYKNSSTDPGPLERDYINPIRRELGLAERVHYVSEPVPAAHKGQYPGGGQQIRFQLNGKEKVLRWRNDLVGGRGVK